VNCTAVSNESNQVGGMEAHRDATENQQAANENHQKSLELQATLEFFFGLC
jgi:hypothetical protein